MEHCRKNVRDFYHFIFSMMTASHLSSLEMYARCKKNCKAIFNTIQNLLSLIFFLLEQSAFHPLCSSPARAILARQRREKTRDGGSQQWECYICKMSVLEYNTSLLAAKSSLLMLVILQCNFFPSLDVRGG